MEKLYTLRIQFDPWTPYEVIGTDFTLEQVEIRLEQADNHDLPFNLDYKETI